MVVCRCGCEFYNPYGDSFVRCPQCNRVYPNVAPNMFEPKTEDERAWTCVVCGTVNPNSAGSVKRTVCQHCGAARPKDQWNDDELPEPVIQEPKVQEPAPDPPHLEARRGNGFVELLKRFLGE